MKFNKKKNIYFNLGKLQMLLRKQFFFYFIRFNYILLFESVGKGIYSCNIGCKLVFTFRQLILNPTTVGNGLI